MLPPWEFEDPSCRGIDSEVFFPPEAADVERRITKDEKEDTLRTIRVMCSSCVERKNCLEWALHNERHGIWAGYTPVDLNRMRRERNIVLKEIDVA